MRNTFILKTILLLFTPINLFCQQKLSEFQVKISKPDEVFIVSDSNGYLACIFQNSKDYEVDFLDPQLKVIGTAITQKIKSDKSQKILGAVMNPQYCYAYFYNKKLKAFSILEVKRNTGEAAYSRIQILNKDEQFLNAFEMDGRFYVLIVPKFTNTVRILILDGKKIEEKNFNIDMSGFYTSLAKKNDLLNTPAESEVGIEEISYNTENNIKSAYPSKKLYHHKGKVYMTFDEPGMTHLITLDIESGSSNYKKLNFALEKGNNSGQKQGNSFLYKNRFFRTTMSPDQLNISIIDLDSMKLIRVYNFYPEGEITARNSPLIQEGAAGYIIEEKEIKRTEQFFRKVLNGNLAIVANEADSASYQLEIGSYEMYTTYNSRPGTTGFGSPGISIGMGMGMGVGIGTGFGYPMGFGSPFYPGFYSGYPGYYSSQPVNRLRVVYFKTLLDKENFHHKEGQAYTSLNSKINEYEHRVFRNSNPELLRISPYKNVMLLGYYSKTGKRYTLVEFKK
jgi:hypothetical protein